MELKMFEKMETIPDKNNPEDEEDCEDLRQIFPSHDALSERYCKTLYYGRLPETDRPSLPFTQLAVEQFTSCGLDALGEKLGRLDAARAGDITRNACAGPNSLVLALLYLEKLRRRNPDYLTTISSADLFLVSLLVASKFLNDDGEEDEVFNDEWASSGGVDTKELNRMEIGFLSALDWRIFVDKKEFEEAVEKVERDIAMKEVTGRGWASYSDLSVLSNSPGLQNLASLLLSYTIKMSAVCMTAYAAGFLSLLGTAAVLDKTPVGPAAVAASLRCLTSPGLAETREAEDQLHTGDLAPDYLDNDRPASDYLPGRGGPSPADLLTASLLVASLTPPSDRLGEDLQRLTEDGGRYEAGTNNSGAAWLADYTDPGAALTRPGPAWSSLQPDLVTRLLGRCPVLQWGHAWAARSQLVTLKG